MRQLALCLAVVGGLVLLAPPASAGGWTLEEFLRERPKSDWDGYGVGTMVHSKRTTTTSAPGMPAPMTNAVETKKTLVKITETHYVIKSEMLVGGQWVASEESEPKHDGSTATVADLGEEAVVIGGTPYPCQKKKVSWTGGEDADETTVWVNATHGILKMTMSGGGTMTVAKLDATWTVGTHTLKGRVIAMDINQPGMGKMTGTMHMCLDIPEGLVRHEMSGSQGPATFTMVSELVALTLM